MFIPATKEKILKLFFSDPVSEIHQREISRLAKVPPHNVNKYLKEFIKDGLLKRREVSNMTFFKINPESEYLFKVFEIFEISKRKEFLSINKKISRLLTEYSDNLVNLSNREIQIVILFGSVARREWTRGSDIDILTLTATRYHQSKIIQIHEDAKRKVSHLLEISPVNVTVDKFVEGIRKKLEFYDELWRDRIVLYNELLFWQLIKEAKFPNA
jgi:predicted nucleotidyltransferase